MQVTDRPPEPEEEEHKQQVSSMTCAVCDIQSSHVTCSSQSCGTPTTPGDDIFRDGVTRPQIRRAAEKGEAIVKGYLETMAQLENKKFENMPPRLFVQIATLLLPEFVRKQDELTLKAQQPVPLAPPSGEGGHGFSSAGRTTTTTHRTNLNGSRFRINAGHLPPDPWCAFGVMPGTERCNAKQPAICNHLRGASLNLFLVDPTNSELQQDIQLVDREISTAETPTSHVVWLHRTSSLSTPHLRGDDRHYQKMKCIAVATMLNETALCTHNKSNKQARNRLAASALMQLWRIWTTTSIRHATCYGMSKTIRASPQRRRFASRKLPAEKSPTSNG